MTKIEVSSNNSKYDARHDVLHVFFGDNSNAFAEETFPGVYVDKDDDTDGVVGLTLMDYKKRKQKIHSWLSQYKFVV